LKNIELNNIVKNNNENNERGNSIFTKNTLLQFIESIYALISCAILIAGLIWCFMILWQVIDKGRMPIEVDPRFFKKMGMDVGLAAICVMGYGSIFWVIINGIVFYIIELKNNMISFLTGLIGLIVNIFIFYLIFFSEVGKWILD